MNGKRKLFLKGGILSRLFQVLQKRSILINIALVVVTFSIMNIWLSPTFKYTRNMKKKTNVASEIRKLRECKCLLNVTIPPKQDLMNKENCTMKQEENNKSETVWESQHLNPTGKKHLVRTVPDKIFKAITLKPNLTRFINASHIITTINTSYILENPTLCSSVPRLDIMIIVHSSPDHKNRRFAIRNTWANDGFYRHLGNVRILFLLGKPKVSTGDQKDIENEFQLYGDILQGNFVDDYHNLTLKGVMGYKWLTERCRNAKLILKVDDDISVNMFDLFKEYFPRFRSANMSIICNHIIAQTMPILRQKSSKWYVNYNHFRGLNSYPTDYCSGFFVLFTNDLIPALYHSAKLTPFFWVDDVYLYGLVPGNVPGIKYIGLTGKWHQLSGQEALNCYRNETAACTFLVAGAGKDREMEDLWPHIFKRYLRVP